MSRKVDSWCHAICVGWVPTLSGNLMYETLAASPVVEVADQLVLYSPGNVKGSEARQESLLYTALVDINDSLPTKNISSYLRLLIWAEKDPDTGNLQGEVWQIDVESQALLDEKSVKKQRETSLKILQQGGSFHSELLQHCQQVARQLTQDQMEQYGRSPQSKRHRPPLQLQSLKTFLHTSIGDSLVDKAQQFTALKTTFVLQRNGLILFKYAKRLIHSSQGYRESVWKHDTDASRFAEDAYVRVKELFHAHRNHSPQSDDVISAVAVNRTADQPREALLRLKRNYFRSLVHNRRSLENVIMPQQVGQVLGFCDYGQSMLVTLEAEIQQLFAPPTSRNAEYKRQILAELTQDQRYLEQVRLSVKDTYQSRQNMMVDALAKPSPHFYGLYRAVMLLAPLAFLLHLLNQLLFGGRVAFCCFPGVSVETILIGVVIVAIGINDGYLHLFKTHKGIVAWAGSCLSRVLLKFVWPVGREPMMDATDNGLKSPNLTPLVLVGHQVTAVGDVKPKWFNHVRFKLVEAWKRRFRYYDHQRQQRGLVLLRSVLMVLVVALVSFLTFGETKNEESPAKLCPIATAFHCDTETQE